MEEQAKYYKMEELAETIKDIGVAQRKLAFVEFCLSLFKDKFQQNRRGIEYLHSMRKHFIKEVSTLDETIHELKSNKKMENKLKENKKFLIKIIHRGHSVILLAYYVNNKRGVPITHSELIELYNKNANFTPNQRKQIKDFFNSYYVNVEVTDSYFKINKSNRLIKKKIKKNPEEKEKEGVELYNYLANKMNINVNNLV